MNEHNKRMNESNYNQTEREITRYLFGEMSENQAASFEIHYLADDSLFDQLMMVRQDLIDGYVRHHLDVATRERFEQSILSTSEGQNDVAFASALREKLNQTTEVKSLGFHLFDWLSRWPLRKLAWAGVAVTLFVGGMWMWNKYIKLPDDATSLKRQTSEETVPNSALQTTPKLPSSSASPTPSLPAQIANPTPNESSKPSYNLLAINVLKGRTKSSKEDDTEIKLPSGDHRPDLTVRIFFKPVGMFCDISLKKPDGITVVQRNVRAYQRQGIFVRAKFPTVKLKPGNYEVIVKGIDSDDSIEKTAAYSFQIKP